MRAWQLLCVVFCVSAVTLGCSKETDSYRFEIKSNVDWSATYGPVGGDQDVAVTGFGNKTIQVKYPPPVCLIVDGQGTGFLDVAAYKHVKKTGSIFSSDDNRDILQDSARTEDPSGEVGCCTQ